MISLDTIYTDLGALTDAELEKVQLAVNGEVAARIQSERLTKRIEKAVIEAQAVGFNDTEINTIITDAKANARTGNPDHSRNPSKTPTPPVMATPSTQKPGPPSTKPSK